MAKRVVIVVEDDPSALSGYMEFLGDAGFHAMGVSDGRKALTLALDDPPAAVVTDITLPGMSGFALAAALHQDPRTRNVPVIGMTGNWSPEVRAQAAEAFVRAVLLKPCVPAHLVAELHRVLDSTG
jgi:putative two-component system response regulator